MGLCSEHLHPMGDVPPALKGHWGRIVVDVLRRLEEATTESELNEALKWWLLVSYSPRTLSGRPNVVGRRGRGPCRCQQGFEQQLRETGEGSLTVWRQTRRQRVEDRRRGD